MIGQELHKIGRRDRKIPISKIGRTAWQNQTDSKNQTDFGFSCKRGVKDLNYNPFKISCTVHTTKASMQWFQIALAYLVIVVSYGHKRVIK